jgi:hypothetical protein
MAQLSPRDIEAARIFAIITEELQLGEVAREMTEKAAFRIVDGRSPIVGEIDAGSDVALGEGAFIVEAWAIHGGMIPFEDEPAAAVVVADFDGMGPHGRGSVRVILAHNTVSVGVLEGIERSMQLLDRLANGESR